MKPLIVDEYNDKKSNDKHNCKAFFCLANSIFPPDSRCGDTVDSRTAYCIIAAMLEWDLLQLLRRACCSRGWTGDLISRRTKKRSSLFERTWKRINMFSSFPSFLIHLDVAIVALHQKRVTRMSHQKTPQFLLDDPKVSISHQVLHSSNDPGCEQRRCWESLPFGICDL